MIPLLMSNERLSFIPVQGKRSGGCDVDYIVHDAPLARRCLTGSICLCDFVLGFSRIYRIPIMLTTRTKNHFTIVWSHI